jgi:hypothetical protein
VIRTQHILFIQSRAATPVIALTASIMAIGMYLPQLMKEFYIRRFHQWL